jgi:predicted ester cyclase
MAKKPSGSDSKAGSVDIFRKYIEYENARDYEKLESLFHPTNFVCHTWFGYHPIQPRALTRMLKGLFRTFPDWYMTINEILVADENTVAGRITGRGTQYEEFLMRPPSDQQIAIQLVHCIGVQKGKIVWYRSTNPFDDPFSADIIAAEDTHEARAQQGVDSRQLERLFRASRASGRVSQSEMASLYTKANAQMGPNQCHALLKANMRRCVMPAVQGDIYCAHHMVHGYGVDGVP